MRRTIVITLVSVTFALALPAIHVDAGCAPLPSVSTVEALRTMRQPQIIVIGTISPTVPSDAHGAGSFFLNVVGYYVGAGPARIEITNYGDGDLPPQASQPGSTVDPSRAFTMRFAGQDAIVFANPDNSPFTHGFQTNDCTYNAFGDAAVADIKSAVRRVFGAPTPPKLATTGVNAASLGLAALTLLVAGASLRRHTSGARV